MTSSTHPAVRFMRNISLKLYLPLALVFALAVVAQPAHAAATQTFTMLTISNANGTTTTATQGTAITLTATVIPNGGQNITSGVVKFCDAAGPSCTDQYLLGTAQVNPYAIATFKFVPGAGLHSYTAVFAGTLTDATSTSQPQRLAVTSANPATITASGQPGNYTLTATIAGGAPVPTGTVSFLDTTNGNASLGTATLSPNASKGIFNLSQTLSLGSASEPSGIATADFNGDGILDLAVLQSGDNSIAIFLGDGSGGYHLASTVTSAGNNIFAIAVGDFNQDGKVDIVASNFNPMTVTTVQGNGDGTFSTGVTVKTGFLAEAVAVADFDGDGIPDIAVAFQPSSGGGGYLTLKGAGDGTFSPPHGAASLYNTGDNNYIFALTPGDFNGDGISDLAISNTVGNLYINNSFFYQGTFYPLGANSHRQLSFCGVTQLAVGDFNGDGKVDLAASCASSSTAQVLLGNGDGTFQSGVSYGVGNDDSAIAVADFNGDGLLDLVTANQTDNTISVLLGKGDGTFQSRATTAVGVEPVALVAGDFNGDGLPDLAVVDSGETSPGSLGPSVNANVEILLNQVTATATLSNVTVAGSGAHLVDASYAGDTNNAAALSTNVVSLNGTQVPTALTVSSSVSTAAYGQQVVLTAKLTPYNAGNISTNGENIIFQSNGANVGIGSLASGVAVLNVTNLPVGTDKLTAVYGGDNNFLTSISAATTVNVQAQVPTLVFEPIANVTTNAAPFPVSASSASPGAITYAVTSGPATLSGSTVTVTGTGTVVLSATQAATANYAAATATTSFTVTAAAPLDFTMVAGAATLSQVVYPGGAATYLLQIAPTGSAYPDNVTFTAVGVPVGASYSFSPAIVPVSNGPAAVSFTVQTATGQASNGHTPLGGLHSRFAPVALGLLLLPFAGMRKLRKGRGKAVLPFCVWLLLLVGTVSLTGCGGATEDLKNYDITVTATSGTVQHSTTVSMQLR